MIIDNNVIAVLLAVLPVFLYCYLVYFLIPPGLVSKRRAQKYFVAGLVSPTLVHIFGYAFPFQDIEKVTTISELVWGVFLGIALVEEVTKYITFVWVTSQRKNVAYDLPIAIAYYAVMSAAGFAIVENLGYLIRYGDGVLFIRGVTAIVLHLLCGLFMGYFIAKYKSVRACKCDCDVETMKKQQRVKKIKYAVLGVGSAALLHGVYDLNLFIPFNNYAGYIAFVIIGFSLGIGYLMIRELVRHSKEIKDRDKIVDPGLN